VLEPVQPQRNRLLQLTAKIVAAQAARNRRPAGGLRRIIDQIYQVLKDLNRIWTAAPAFGEAPGIF